MKHRFALIFLLLAFGVPAARAQSPEDQYVRIYNLIQQGDAQAATRPAQALTNYLEAQSALQRIQKLFPDWNIKVVNYRLGYLAEKISELAAAKPVAAVAVSPPPAARPKPAVEPKPPTTAPAPPSEPSDGISAEAGQRIGSLQDEVRRLQADKVILEAKVKEALATQPAAIDPRELARAREQIQSLLKENELLKVSAASQAQPAPPQPAPAADSKELEQLRAALADSDLKLAAQTARASLLAGEKETLQQRLAVLSSGIEDTNELASLQRALRDANRKLAEQTVAARQLASEQQILQQRVSALSASAAEAEPLRAENKLLKEQLAQARSAPPAAGREEEAARRLAEAESRIAALQSDAGILRLEKNALEERLKTAAAAAAPSLREADARRIQQLEQERDATRKQLEAANKDLKDGRERDLAARSEKPKTESAGSGEHETALQASTVTNDNREQPLAGQSAPQPAAPDTAAGKKQGHKLPPGTTALATEAQRHFAAREFDQAEASYRDILRQDEQNTATLANLARVQIENKRFDEAEKNIRAALAAAPDDGYSLFILGYLKLQQEKYSEALDPLSRAARVNPRNAEIQNCLGVTLSHQGQSGPAETAFRKAIQVDPGYGNAHNNLAILYAGQTPPLVELARWHYQKALAAGQPRNAELEKTFERKATAVAK